MTYSDFRRKSLQKEQMVGKIENLNSVPITQDVLQQHYEQDAGGILP